MRYESGHFFTALAAIGGASLLFVGASLGKLALALRNKTDFETIFLRSPSRDAFVGRVFWITGASSGIGKALSIHLCTSCNNIRVILSSRREDVLKKVAAECRERNSSNQVEILPFDLSKLSSLSTKAEEALELFGRVDVLVNNGGVSTRSMARDTSFQVDKFVVDVNFLSYVALTKALLPSWEQPRSFKPMVINTSSVAGKLGAPVRTAYCAAKHAIHGWFDAFRIEQVMSGIPVNVLNVILGSTRTNVAHNAIVEALDNTFDSSDPNIEAGLEPDDVVKKVLAAANAGCQEIWIAPEKEILLLYLHQYLPDMARKILIKLFAKEYAVQKL